MLVIEGAGRLGKTTAARRLVQMAHDAGFGQAEYRHMRRPPPTFNFGSDYWPMICDHAVQDRFHLGGLAWHNIGETGLDEMRVRVIQAKIHAVGGLIVVFTCSDTNWFKEQWLKTQDLTKQGVTHEIGVQIDANEYFTWQLADWADQIVEVGPGGFVTDQKLSELLAEWMNRRQFALE
jgi:hypothetical protein